MLKDKITHNIENQDNLELFPIEEDYAKKHELLSVNKNVENKQWDFSVIERCLKETEEVLKEEQASFMTEPLTYFSERIDEFLYVESTSFDTLGVDGMALEMDDVFQTYTVLFGLKVQKKWGPFLKEYLGSNIGLQTFSAMFSDQDGLWDINIPIDKLDGFEKDMTITDAVDLAFRFIFKLLEAIEAAN